MKSDSRDTKSWKIEIQDEKLRKWGTRDTRLLKWKIDESDCREQWEVEKVLIACWKAVRVGREAEGEKKKAKFKIYPHSIRYVWRKFNNYNTRIKAKSFFRVKKKVVVGNRDW